MSRKTSHHAAESVARRRVMLAVAAGAATSLPERWARPVVESVVLPAHAQTTERESRDPVEPQDPCPTTPVPSTPSSIVAQTADEPPEDFDNADINFDGCDNLALVVTDSDENLGGPATDVVLSVDVDPWGGDDTSDSYLTFDVTHLGGANWNVLSDDFGGSSDLTPGTYTIVIERIGGGNEGRRFEVEVTVNVTTVDDTHQQVELSGVTATPL